MSLSYSTVLELLLVYGLACRREATSYTTIQYRTSNYGTVLRYCSLYKTATISRPNVNLLFFFALIFDFDFGTVYMR
jgi:hypothetical protein